MTEYAGKPKIRFTGFTEAWEQRKLGDCFAERDERSSDGELLSVTVNDGIKRFEELGRYDNSSDDKSRYKRVEIGDIAYNSMRMWQGASGYSSYQGIVSPAYTVLIPNDNIDSIFFSYIFKRSQQIHMFQICSQGITSDTWSLKYPTFSQIKTKVPKFLEQKKIGAFFRHLDRLIALHQRKHDRLKNIKKAMLEKMFPKHGADVPEVRFARFTEAWEQRKFGKIAIRNSAMAACSNTLPGVEYEDIVSEQGILNKDIRTKEAVKNGIKFLPGNILFGKLRPYLKNWLLPDFSGVAIGDFWVLQPSEIDSQYLYYLIQTPAFHEVSNQSTGTKMPRADWNLVANSMFFLPRNDEEQVKIGLVLQAVDRLITLHQHKVVLLQNIKKVCLERMFV